MSGKRNCKIIAPKEARQVLGISISSAYRVMKKIRLLNNKLSGQPLTVKEFCDYFKMSADDVFAALGWE